MDNGTCVGFFMEKIGPSQPTATTLCKLQTLAEGELGTPKKHQEPDLLQS
ncbi:hypothetical protein [Caballeronia sp. CLC5]|nr:hypothetical protein [Caballeronia sp. CLC5]MCE4573550.1 hypothetical protein [Caballeronia sp. CLC5]